MFSESLMRLSCIYRSFRNVSDMKHSIRSCDPNLCGPRRIPVQRVPHWESVIKGETTFSSSHAGLFHRVTTAADTNHHSKGHGTTRTHMAELGFPLAGVPILLDTTATWTSVFVCGESQEIVDKLWLFDCYFPCPHFHPVRGWNSSWYLEITPLANVWWRRRSTTFFFVFHDWTFRPRRWRRPGK